MGERALFRVVAVILFISLLLPVLLMFFGSFFDDGKFTLSAYHRLLQNDMMLKSLGNSFLLALSVAFSTVLAGTGLGVLLAKSDIPYGNFFAALFAIPLLIPPYILAFAWSGLFGEWFFGFWGVWFVLLGIYLPVPMFLTMLYLRQIDPELEEAGLLLGSWSRVLGGITLPLLGPAMLFSFLLVFILSFGEYSVANFLRYPLFATQSFVYFSAFYDFQAAIAASLPILFVVALVIGMEYILNHNMRFDFSHSRNMQKFSLGRWRAPVLFTILALAATVVLLPLTMLLIQVGDLQTFLAAADKAWGPMTRSLLFAFAGATLLALFGFLSAYMLRKKLFWWRRWFDGSILFMFALPSSVLGIALILMWNRPYTNFIYATPLIIILGYLGKYLALSSKICEIKLMQIPRSFREAAELGGARWYEVICFILLPLSRDALLAAWIVGYIFVMRDDTLAMILHPPGESTLSVYISTQMANGAPSLIASLCLLMVLLTLLPAAVYLMVKRKQVVK